MEVEQSAMNQESLGTYAYRCDNGQSVSSGTFTVFSKDKPVTVSFPLQADTVYVQMTMQGTQAEKLNFKVNKLTPDELELTYMDRGGVLKFEAIK